MSDPHDNLPHDDLDPPLSEADVTSQTRFGPRPVPEGHRRLHETPQMRRIPPHGDVSPDGRKVWPRPSKSAKWLVWGGTALTAAALTAGAVIAGRQVAQMLSDDKPRPSLPPARPQSAMQPAMPQRRPMAPPSTHWDRPGDQPPRRRKKPRPRLIDDIQDNSATLNRSVDGVMRSLGSAISGFRTVAAQAGSIMREFSDAADLVRGVMGHTEQPQRRPRKAPSQRPAHPSPKDPSDYAQRHGAPMPDLHDDPAPQDPPYDPVPKRRTHRL